MRHFGLNVKKVFLRFKLTTLLSIVTIVPLAILAEVITKAIFFYDINFAKQ